MRVRSTHQPGPPLNYMQEQDEEEEKDINMKLDRERTVGPMARKAFRNYTQHPFPNG